ncbi:hypothetical protein GE09DRAFT_254884 [Coniochaeta sp. 2T2.1]|nr:hypothetical protein GE09DRAFT_254884 [Coniochaeta sp. 2T2.1]
MASRHTPPPIVLTEEPHQMTPKASPAPNEFHTGAAASAAIEGPLHIQPPQGPPEPPARTAASRMGTLTHHPSAAAASTSRPTTPGTVPKAVPHMSPYRHLADCNEAICKERIRLNTAKRNAGFFRKPKKDEALKDLISARDFVRNSHPYPTASARCILTACHAQIFVVDRAPTMIHCWEWATFLVETLAMKLARIDDDGLDLVFTSGAGAEYNLTKEKSASAFKLAMQRAEPKVHAPRTDMSICLGEISRSYWSKVHRKKLTLIIVTDGMWGLLPSSSSGSGNSGGSGSGPARENPVDNKITNFLKDLRATVGESKVEDRWFSIQFISFATNPLAHAYLKFLDSGFWKKHGIPRNRHETMAPPAGREPHPREPEHLRGRRLGRRGRRDDDNTGRDGYCKQPV